MENKEPVENKESKELVENKMEIEISKYKNLVDALGDPVRVARMVLLIAAVAAILAVGIIGVVCGIKRFYPYKSINSNPYGATIIQDEDNEIIYWLFNSADLWANSGIEVKEGDVISVRTSGAFHTAIHHLVDDAIDNTILRNPWSHSEGKGPLPGSPLYERSIARSEYRIVPGLPSNTILMQVIPSDVCGKKEKPNWRTDPDKVCYVDGLPYTSDVVKDHWKSGLQTKQKNPDIYEIGLGKENIRIRTDGFLHFTVNDIALTQRVIDRMMDTIKKQPNMQEKLDLADGWQAKITEKFDSLFNKNVLSLVSYSFINDCTIMSKKWNRQFFFNMGLIDEDGRPIEQYWNTNALQQYSIINDGGWSIIAKDTTIMKNKERHLIGDSILVIKGKFLSDSIFQKLNKDNKIDTTYLNNICVRKGDSIVLYKDQCMRLNKSFWDTKTLTQNKIIDTAWTVNELQYYRETNFVDAWFVDNIGSFMIVIERKKVR